MALLDKSSILSAMALKTETVQLDGGEVIVSEVTAESYMEIWESPLAKTDGDRDGSKFSSLLVTRCIVDGSGNRIFADDEVAALRQGSTRVYTKLVAASQRVNGMAAELPKNSGETATGDSSSGSVSTSDTDTPTN